MLDLLEFYDVQQLRHNQPLLTLDKPVRMCGWLLLRHDAQRLPALRLYMRHL